MDLGGVAAAIIPMYYYIILIPHKNEVERISENLEETGAHNKMKRKIY